MNPYNQQSNYGNQYGYNFNNGSQQQMGQQQFGGYNQGGYHQQQQSGGGYNQYGQQQGGRGYDQQQQQQQQQQQGSYGGYNQGGGGQQQVGNYYGQQYDYSQQQQQMGQQQFLGGYNHGQDYSYQQYQDPQQQQQQQYQMQQVNGQDYSYQQYQDPHQQHMYRNDVVATVGNKQQEFFQQYYGSGELQSPDKMGGNINGQYYDSNQMHQHQGIGMNNQQQQYLQQNSMNFNDDNIDSNNVPMTSQEDVQGPTVAAESKSNSRNISDNEKLNKTSSSSPIKVSRGMQQIEDATSNNSSLVGNGSNQVKQQYPYEQSVTNPINNNNCHHQHRQQEVDQGLNSVQEPSNNNQKVTQMIDQQQHSQNNASSEQIQNIRDSVVSITNQFATNNNKFTVSTHGDTGSNQGPFVQSSKRNDAVSNKNHGYNNNLQQLDRSSMNASNIYGSNVDVDKQQNNIVRPSPPVVATSMQRAPLLAPPQLQGPQPQQQQASSSLHKNTNNNMRHDNVIVLDATVPEESATSINNIASLQDADGKESIKAKLSKYTLKDLLEAKPLPYETDKWWPQGGAVQREQELRREMTKNIMMNPLSQFEAEVVIQKLPHCRVNRFHVKDRVNEVEKIGMFCFQVAHLYPSETLVCCSECFTWRHVCCGGHHELSLKNEDIEHPGFVALCEECYKESEMLNSSTEEDGIVSKLKKERHKHLRRTAVMNEVARHAALSKTFHITNGNTVIWPPNNVGPDEQENIMQMIQARMDNAAQLWAELVVNVGNGPTTGGRQRERTKARSKEFNRLHGYLRDAENTMDRENMKRFLEHDLSRDRPIGYEDELRNYFDSDDDESDDEYLYFKSIKRKDSSSNNSFAKKISKECLKIECKKKTRFDSSFCSDACGIHFFEKQLLENLQYADSMHPNTLKEYMARV